MSEYIGTKQKGPQRVALYLRVSTTNSQTTENQRLELQQVADRSGWEVVRIYEDEGVSGAKGRGQRPGLDALMKDAARRDLCASDGSQHDQSTDDLQGAGLSGGL